MNLKTYLELDVEVEYSAHKGCRGDWNNPPEDPEAEVEAVYLKSGDKKVDIIDYLKDEDFEQLAEDCLEDAAEKETDAKVEAADRKLHEMKDEGLM